MSFSFLHMGRRQHILFALCALMIVVGAFNAYYLFKIHHAKQQLLTAEQTFKQLNNQTSQSHLSECLSETSQSVQALNAQMSQLTQQLLSKHNLFFKDTEQTAVEFSLKLQEFINEQQALAKHLNVVIANPQEAFGFSEWLQNIPDTAQSPVLIQQYLMTRFILNALFHGNPPPHSLLSIKRQPIQTIRVLEPQSLTSSLSLKSIFPELETHLISLECVAKTSTLRSFLNALASAPIPLIVRSFSTKPYSKLSLLQQAKITIECVDIPSALKINTFPREMPKLSKVGLNLWHVPEKGQHELFYDSRSATGPQLPFSLRCISRRVYPLQLKGFIELPNHQFSVFLLSTATSSIHTLKLHERDPHLRITLEEFHLNPVPTAVVLDHQENQQFHLSETPTFYEHRFTFTFQPNVLTEPPFSVHDTERVFRFQNKDFSILDFSPSNQTVTIRSTHDDERPHRLVGQL